MMPPPILVAGASGFVGRRLVRTMEERGMRGTGLSRRPDGGQAGSVARRFVRDYADSAAIREAASDCRVAIMLAGRAHVSKASGVGEMAAFLAANRDTPVQVATDFAAAGGKRFVYVSSIAVNGVRTVGTPFGPSSPAAPVNAYGQSKHAGETALQHRCSELGLDLVIIRPPMVYGPAAPGNFGTLLRAVRAGLPLPLGSVTNRRDFIGVDNLVDLLLTAACLEGAVGQIFLASDCQRTSTAEFLRLLYRAAGMERRIMPFPPAILKLAAKLTGRQEMIERLIDDLEIDASLATERLGWHPPLSLDQGLVRSVNERAGA